MTEVGGPFNTKIKKFVKTRRYYNAMKTDKEIMTYGYRDLVSSVNYIK